MGEFVAVTFLPAAAVTCIFNSSTILGGLLLFWPCLREKITPSKILFAVMCIIGVILVIQPWKEARGLNFGSKMAPALETYQNGTKLKWEPTSEENSNQLDLMEDKRPTYFRIVDNDNVNKKSVSNSLIFDVIGYTTAMLGGLSFALEILVVKKIPYIKEYPKEVLFWGWCIGAIISALLMASIETPVLPSNLFDVSMVTVQAVTSSAVWPLVIYGSNKVSGNTFTVISSTMVVFMLISQYTVLSSVHPDTETGWKLWELFLCC